MQLKLASTTEDKLFAYALRYKAYRSVSAIPECSKQLFCDEYDDAENCFTYLLLDEGKVVGSIRACVWTPAKAMLTPCLQAYPESTHDLSKHIFIESNRFVVDPEINSNRAVMGLFKAIALHAYVENARYIVTAVRKEHYPFYKRTLRMSPISDEKIYPGLQVPMMLLAVSVQEEWHSVTSRLKPLMPTEDDINQWKTEKEISLL